MTSHIKHKIAVQQGTKSGSINIFVPQKTALKTWAKAGLASLKHPVEVCIRLVDKSEMQALNSTYRKKDVPTNVLSFPAELPDNVPQKMRYLGDIVLCTEIIQEEAVDQQKTPESHWAHMVIHGILHLQGYDHIQDEEATTMETLETQLLAKLGFPNPYEGE